MASIKCDGTAVGLYGILVERPVRFNPNAYGALLGLGMIVSGE
jgi:hypothetical protein